MRIIVKEVSSPKKATNGNEYILVKSIKDSVVSIWDDQRAIWHLFTVGADLDVTTYTRGKYTSIVGVAGVEPQNPATGQNLTGNGIPSAWDKLFVRLDKMEASLDFLIEEKKQIKGLESQERKTLGLPPETQKKDSGPFNYQDLPVTDLPDLN